MCYVSKHYCRFYLITVLKTNGALRIVLYMTKEFENIDWKCEWILSDIQRRDSYVSSTELIKKFSEKEGMSKAVIYDRLNRMSEAGLINSEERQKENVNNKKIWISNQDIINDYLNYEDKDRLSRSGATDKDIDMLRKEIYNELEKRDERILDIKNKNSELEETVNSIRQIVNARADTIDKLRRDVSDLQIWKDEFMTEWRKKAERYMYAMRRYANKEDDDFDDSLDKIKELQDNSK